MSVDPAPGLPTGDAPARAEAKQTLWRLLALAVAHPTPETHAFLVDGRFEAAFGAAWRALTGRPWQLGSVPADRARFEAGYIHAFLHGFKGRPVAPLLAGDHEPLLAGLSRPVFMLNLSAFYKHFGLRAATGDEGRLDEPDHLAAMAEFMAVLCHLEAGALASGRDAGPGRRAQRDFLRRYVGPLLHRVDGRLARDEDGPLAPGLRGLLADMSDWAEAQAAELEARVGPYRDPDAPAPPSRPGGPAEPATQNLWG